MRCTMVTGPGRRARTWLTALGMMLIFGCASYDGSSLIAGKSTEADILALMGPPDEKVTLASGDIEWFYTRPAGKQTYAITIGPDGRFRSSEQRLDRTYIDRIRRDTWTMQDVRALLGPPEQVTRFERQKRDVWTYRWRDYADRRVLYVQFSYDGIVREVLDMLDPTYLPAGPGVFMGVGAHHARAR